MGHPIRHFHDGRRYYAKALTMQNRNRKGMHTLEQREGITLPVGTPKWPKIGTWCPYCGFTPSPLAKELQLQAMEQHMRGK